MFYLPIMEIQRTAFHIHRNAIIIILLNSAIVRNFRICAKKFPGRLIRHNKLFQPGPFHIHPNNLLKLLIPPTIIPNPNPPPPLNNLLQQPPLLTINLRQRDILHYGFENIFWSGIFIQFIEEEDLAKGEEGED